MFLRSAPRPTLFKHFINNNHTNLTFVSHQLAASFSAGNSGRKKLVWINGKNTPRKPLVLIINYNSIVNNILLYILKLHRIKLHRILYTIFEVSAPNSPRNLNKTVYCRFHQQNCCLLTSSNLYKYKRKLF